MDDGPTPVISEFERELASLLNRNSKENESNTPDFILANYLLDCLGAFNRVTVNRDKWWGFVPKIGHGSDPLP